MSAALWHPPTPEKEEVEEELCVEKVVRNLPEATPFFDHGNKILVKGGQVGAHCSYLFGKSCGNAFF